MMQRLKELTSGIIGNVAVLLSGSVFASILGLAVAPILTRLYDPSSFGQLAIFMAIVSSVAPLATLRYELSITLCKSDRLARNGVLLSILSAVLVSTFFGLVLFLFSDNMFKQLGTYSLQPYVIFVPVSIFCLSVITAVNYWFTRLRKFHLQSLTYIIQNLVRVVFQLTFGFIGLFQTTGLLVGQIIAHASGMVLIAILYMRNVRRHNSRVMGQNLNCGTLIKFAHSYRSLPQHAFTTNFLNGLASNIFPIILAYFFSPAAAGLLFLAQQVLAAPVGMLTSALWRVYYGRLSEKKDNFHASSNELLKIHTGMSILLSIPIFLVISFSEYSSLLFGENWGEFYKIVPAFCVFLFVKHLSNSTSYFTVFQKYTAESIWNIVNLAVRVLSIIVASIVTSDPALCISIYCLISTFVYLGINTYWGLIAKQLIPFYKNILFSFIPMLMSSLYLSFFVTDIEIKLIGTIIILALFLYLSIKKIKIINNSVDRISSDKMNQK